MRTHHAAVNAELASIAMEGLFKVPMVGPLDLPYVHNATCGIHTC